MHVLSNPNRVLIHQTEVFLFHHHTLLCFDSEMGAGTEAALPAIIIIVHPRDAWGDCTSGDQCLKRDAVEAAATHSARCGAYDVRRRWRNLTFLASSYVAWTLLFSPCQQARIVRAQYPSPHLASSPSILHDTPTTGC